MFFCLLTGLLVAFAIQLLIASFGLAAGLSSAEWIVSGASDGSSAESAAESALPLTHLLGAGIAFSSASTLFGAVYLTTQLAPLGQPNHGIVFGVILWAGYTLLLAGLSTLTLTGLIETTLSLTTGGISRLFSLIKAASRRTAQVIQSDSESAADSRENGSAKTVSATQTTPEQIKIILTNSHQPAKSSLDEPDGSAMSEDLSVPTSTASLTPETTSSSSLLFQQAQSAIQDLIPSWRSLLNMALSRVDIDDIEIESIWNVLQQFVPEEQKQRFSVVLLDAEEYLTQTPRWSLLAEGLAQAFSDRVYDSEADPVQVSEQVNQLEDRRLRAWLQQRGDLSDSAVDELTIRLSKIRQQILSKLDGAISSISLLKEHSDQQFSESAHSSNSLSPDIAAAIETVEGKLASYFKYTSLNKLSPESIEEKVRSLLEENGLLNAEGFSASMVLDVIALDPLVEIIAARRNITPRLKQDLTDALSRTWEGVRERGQLLLEGRSGAMPLRRGDVSHRGLGLERPRRWARRAARTARDWEKDLSGYIRDYLRQETDISQIDADLVHLVKTAARTLSAPVSALPELDLNFWKDSLRDRADLTQTEKASLQDKLQRAWRNAVNTLPELNQEIQSTTQQITNVLNHGLLRTVYSQVSTHVEDAIQQTQAEIEEKAIAIKDSLAEQVDQIRIQATIAAWWLFLTLISSMLASATAGWLAITYPIPPLR